MLADSQKRRMRIVQLVREVGDVRSGMSETGFLGQIAILSDRMILSLHSREYWRMKCLLPIRSSFTNLDCSKFGIRIQTMNYPLEAEERSDHVQPKIHSPNCHSTEFPARRSSAERYSAASGPSTE